MKKTGKLAAIAIALMSSLVGMGANPSTVIDDYEPPRIVKPVREKPDVNLIDFQKRVKKDVRRITPSSTRQAKRDGEVQTKKTTFNKIPFSTEVFEEDDVLGFNAIRELQRNSADKEMVKKAIIASGHKRGGIPLDQTLMVFADGTRMEVTIPVVDGCLDNNTVVVLEDGAVTNNFSETYVGDLVAIYGGTNITSLGQSIFIESKTLVEAVFPSVTNIGIQAFALCDNLALVSCPLVETVGCQSFLYDSNLRAIDMPNLVKIEELAVEEGQENDHTGNNFRGCTSLEFLSLPSLESIEGQSSFNGCTSLKEAYLPKLKNMPIGTFEGAPLERVDFQSLASYDVEDYAWEETEEKDGQTVVKTNHYYYVPFMNAKMHKLELPSLTEVPDYGFWNLQNFRELDFPSAKNVGKEAFRYGFELTDVKLHSATNIADKAFVYCTNLRRMFLPNVETLGIEVFHLAGLREIEITKLGKLEFGTFLQCPQLKTPILPALTNAASQADAVNNRNDGFAYTGLEEINLTEVKVVGSNMFEGSDKLRTVWLPSAERIGRRAFALCKSLEELYLCDGTNGVQDVIIPESAADMELGLFSGVPGTVNVIVPDRLYDAWKTNEIWSALNVNIYSWSNYKPVRREEYYKKTVNMGDGVTNMVFSMAENRKFTVKSDERNPTFTIDPRYSKEESGEAEVIIVSSGITTLHPIRYPDLKTYGNFIPRYSKSVYSSSGNLFTINGPATVKFQFKDTGDYELVIHSGGSGTGQPDIWTETVPYIEFSRNDIGDDGISTDYIATFTSQNGSVQKYNLSGVVTKSTMKYLGLMGEEDGNWGENRITSAQFGSRVTGLDNSAFYKCHTLSSVTIPGSVTNIGLEAFNDCTNLTTVTISTGLTTIGQQAFQNCKAMRSLTIPNTCTSIGDYAFYFCSGLTSISIGANIQSIGYAAFLNCESLSEIVLPDSVINVSEYVFYGCKGLSKVVTGNGVKSLPDNIFQGGCTNIQTVVFGNSMTNLVPFVNHSSWYPVLSNVVVGTSVTKIPESAFQSYQKLKTVTISGNSVTNIGGFAFYDCKELTSIDLGDGLQTIDGQASFGNCLLLTEITIPASCTSIGPYAFYNTQRLNDVTFTGKTKDTVTNMANYSTWGLKSGCVIHCTDGDITK